VKDPTPFGSADCNAAGSTKGGTNGHILAKYAPAECR
jgi:hypothetical protein